MGKLARVLSVILSTLASIAMFKFLGNTVTILNVSLFKNVVIVALMLSNVFPQHFSMGVEDFRKTNWFIRVLPIVPTTFILFAFSLLEKTYAVVGLVSVIFGIQLGYILYLIAIVIDNKFSHRR